MASPTAHTCSRCGRQNPSRARFCAQCGLNLAAAGADEVTRTVRRNGRKTGTGLVLFLILLGLCLALLGSLFRVRPCNTSPRLMHPHFMPSPDRLERRMPHEVIRRNHTEWHSEWQIHR